MLMMSSRHLDPYECSFLICGKKFGEMQILKIFKYFGLCQKLRCFSFFGQYTIAMSALNFLERTIINNLTHNLWHFLFLTPDDIVMPE